MPKGSKEYRMEKHIEASERKSGKSPNTAKRIAFATINARKSKAKSRKK